MQFIIGHNPELNGHFSIEKIKEVGERYGLKGRSFTYVEDAYNQALSESENDDFIFVGGSSYIVADFLSKI